MTILADTIFEASYLLFVIPTYMQDSGVDSQTN